MEPLNGQLWQKLQEIIDTYGVNICDEPNRLEGLLRDQCGQYKREIRLLINTLKEGVVSDLSQGKGSMPAELLVPQSCKKIEENLLISPEAAEWAVKSWAIALRLKLSESQNYHPQEEVATISNKHIYFMGETHFDHKNIIKYCHRPFANVAEMNRAIIYNWNKTVGENDTVYFLGDYTGPLPQRLYFEKLSYWTEQLTGFKTSILGNHDRNGGCIKFNITKVLHVNGLSFLLIHDPTYRKTEWHGWIIHGHIHNNKMDRYPFINGEQKTINVSAELINYKPVSLSYLLSLDLDSIKRMRTINEQPERK